MDELLGGFRGMTLKEKRQAGTQISWNQVTAFRLRRHHLSERAPAGEIASVLADMCGAQAQLLSAAQMSIWARVRDLQVEDMETAIWKDRILAKAWCMRRTLYLLPSKDVAIFVRGSARRAEKEVEWMRRNGVPNRTLEELLAAVLQALDQPLTRLELAERVSKSLGLRMRAKRGGGWGSQRLVPCVEVGDVTCPAGYLLHLAGARGVVCSGPSRGNETTYVRADAWLPRWRDVPAERAERELLRRYVRAFGPVTPRDFAAWTRMRLSDARAIWSHEEANLEPVDVEGWLAWVLRRDLSELESAEIKRPTVRLLPCFDSFLLGHEERKHLVEARNHSSVYRAQGWIAPVVLVNGRAAGTWSHTRKGQKLNVRAEPFAPVSRSVSNQIRWEGRELGRYLGCSTVDTTIA